MDDFKIEELRVIHRELARHLAAQNETLASVTKTVGAIQHALDSDSAPQGLRSALSDIYKGHLASAIASEPPQRRPSALDSLLKKLMEW